MVDDAWKHWQPGKCIVYVFGGTTRSVQLKQTDVDHLLRIQFTDLGVEGSPGAPRWDMYIEDMTNTPCLGTAGIAYCSNTQTSHVYFGGVSGFMESIACTMICGAIPLALGHGSLNPHRDRCLLGDLTTEL